MKTILAGIGMLALLNSCGPIGCFCGESPIVMRSFIELSGLQYDKVKIELSEFSENISEFYHYADISASKLKELTGASVTINSKKIKFNVSHNIELNTPTVIHSKSINFLKLKFWGFRESLGRTYSYRLKVDTDGLKVNKNLFDKKIAFTPKDSWIRIYINILNKKVDIKY